MNYNKYQFDKISIEGLCSDDQKAQINANFSKGLTNLIEYLQRHSIGDYIVKLESHQNKAYIASSGFSGAYLVKHKEEFIYCKNISDVSIYKPYHQFNLNWIISTLTISKVVPEGLFNPHDDVYNIDSLDLILIENGRLTLSNIASPLYEKNAPDSYPKDVLAALKESIEEHFKYGDITIMLSGGVDSTLIGLAATELGYEPRFVNTYRSATSDNNPKKAKEVAKRFNWNLETVKDDSFFSNESQDYLLRIMSENVINPMNPHWDVNGQDGVILSGQNADSIIGMDISKAADRASLLKHPKSFITSLAKDAIALDDSILQSLYNRLLGVTGISMAHDLGDKFIDLKSGNKKLNELFLAQYNPIQALSSRTGELSTNRAKIEMFAHYSYRTWALRLISSSVNRYGSKTMLPYQSSPYISYYANQKRRLKELNNPKWREAGVLSSRLGRDYYSFLSEIDEIKPSDNYALKRFKLQGALLTLKEQGFTDKLIQKFGIIDEKVESYIEKSVSAILIKDKENTLDRVDLNFGFRLLNLYLLREGKADS